MSAPFPGVILIDCDGVLTDGTLNINHDGSKVFKSFSSRDVRAIRELVSMGYDVVIVSADDWPGGRCYADKVGAFFEVHRDKSEVAKKYHNYIAVGDDAWDVAMLKGATLAFAPNDCDPSVLAVPRIVQLKTCGGRGVIAELLLLLCQQCSRQ